MNVQRSSTKTFERSDARHGSETRLHGRWLVLVRSAWVLLVLFTVGLFVASLPVYFALFHTVCSVATQCASGQLSTKTATVVYALGLSLNAYAAIGISLKAVFLLVWLAVPALIVWRKSNDWLALLVALMFVTVSTGNADVDLPMLTHLVSPSLAFFLSACSNFLSTLSFFLVFALFPNGQFVPRWTRWVLPFALAWGVANFFPALSSTLAVTLLGDALWGGCAGLLALAQIYRYRQLSTLMQRQQIKWVAWSLAIVFLFGIIFEFMLPLIFPSLGQPDSLYQLLSVTLFTFAILPIPLSFGVALLRYRLWDVDVLINRTLVYGSLTTLLALLYFGLIFSLQALFQGMFHQNNEVAIVVSTLAIAALFQPLRHRIQAIIDRRFYRRKYDAARTLVAFSATLRNEVDLTTLSEHLVAVVEETMQPAHISLWLNKGDQRRKPNIDT